LGDVPRLAGLHPAYIARQLYAFQTGMNHSVSSALMKKVAAHLNEDDLVAITAYIAAQ
jgi:cytochrome c553